MAQIREPDARSSGPPARSQIRPVGSREWVKRFAGVVVTLCVLAWAWNESGMTDASSLWTNRERAIDYIFGKPIDESTLEERRRQALRDVRTDLQIQARREIKAEYRDRGDPSPGMMVLMRESEERAREMLESMPEGELDALVRQRLDEDSNRSRKGGYFPPETDPVAIFGDPEDLGDLHWSVSWIVSLADRAGGRVRSAARWVLSSITGEGYTGLLFETIAIAVWGTLLAVIVSVPASLLGSTVTMRILWPGERLTHRAGRWIGRFVIKRSFDIARGFNEIVLAMIFVAVLGLGPLPGVIALVIHTYGILGKVFSEAIETIDQKQVEGVQATGAAPTQVISYAVLTQISPNMVSWSLLRFESNVRGATILGVVGAGGIGQHLMDKFGAYEFQEVATMMILIIIVVTLIDFGCTSVMRRFI